MTAMSTAGGAPAELIAARELAEATRLARRGHYARAKVALASARTTPASLDLLARIAAQQGRYDEAAALWQDAAERLGEPGAFAAELAALNGLRSRRPHRGPRAVVALLALGALAGLVATVVSRLRSWPRRRHDPAGAHVDEWR
jgi:hypothetical protein